MRTFEGAGSIEQGA